MNTIIINRSEKVIKFKDLNVGSIFMCSIGNAPMIKIYPGYDALVVSCKDPFNAVNLEHGYRHTIPDDCDVLQVFKKVTLE